jgi:predicted transcriptional regulator
MGADQFSVVGCGTCSELWIVKELHHQESASCPRCQTTHAADQLREKASADEYEVAAELRSRQLAARAGESEAYADEPDYGVAGEQADAYLSRFDELLAEDADRHLGRFDDLYAERAETYLAQFEDRYAEQVDTSMDQYRERYAERADAYLDDLFSEYDHLIADTEREYAFEFDEPAETLRVRPTPPAQQTLSTVQVDVPPTVSEWVPYLLVELLDPLTSTVESYAAEYGIDQSERLALGLIENVLDVEPDSRVRSYVTMLTSYALRASGPDQSADHGAYRADLDDHAEGELTAIGTGAGGNHGSLDLLWAVVVPLLQAGEQAVDVVARLDATAWDDCDRRATRERSLRALLAIADAAETTVVCGPAIERTLSHRHPEWFECVTADCNPRREQARSPTDSTPSPDQLAVYLSLRDMKRRPGKLAVLDHLDRNDGATVRDMVEDAAIELEASSVRAYIEALVDAELVAVDQRGRTNTHSLTARGAVAVGLVDQDGRVSHPEQASVLGEFQPASELGDESETGSVTEIIQSEASTVCGAARSGEGVDGAPAAEAALAATGNAAEADYVQWLPKAKGSAYPVHARSTAADAGTGISFNPYPATEFEDARTTYLSCLNDRAVVVTQYSGALKTLVRIATALLSPKAWGTILPPSAVGADLDGCFDELEMVHDDILDLLRNAAQVGWLSDEHAEYTDYRNRITGVSCRLREQLSGIDALDDEARQELMRDAHGLLQSATALYHALDIPITIDLRVPDKNRTSERDLAAFLANTVPRQAYYGAHSVYRNTWESRSEKRRQRLRREIQPGDAQADLPASWVVTGPDADEYLPETRSQLERMHDRREDDRTDYDPIEIPIELTDASSYPTMRQAVERFLKKKDLLPYGDDTRLREVVRLFMAYTGSPYDIADALTSLRGEPRDVRLHDIEFALGTLHHSRLFPGQPPTVGKLLKALFTADEPLSRAELLEAADVSPSSYSRHKATLDALDLIERVDGGNWVATVAPWFVPESDRTEPIDADHLTGSGASLRPGDVLYDLLSVLGADMSDDRVHDAFGAGSTIDYTRLEAVLDHSVWRWIEDLRVLLESFTDAVGRFSETTVELGDTPDQTTLKTATVVAD